MTCRSTGSVRFAALALRVLYLGTVHLPGAWAAVLWSAGLNMASSSPPQLRLTSAVASRMRDGLLLAMDMASSSPSELRLMSAIASQMRDELLLAMDMASSSPPELRLTSAIATRKRDGLGVVVGRPESCAA